jgi:hypothetical protein
MNGRMLIRGIAICLMLALAGCATAPAQELSILDAMREGSTSKPLSCAALDAATLCVQSSRLDRTKDCSCIDRHAVSDGQMFKF